RQGGPVMAERILSAIGTVEFELGNGAIQRKTCSVGWAPFPWLPPSHGELSVEEVLRFADHGLYVSKQHGRNQSTGILPGPDLCADAGHTRLEEFLHAGLLVEIRTPGPVASSTIAPTLQAMAQKSH